jgi:large-conductance mechanosensitive channel
VIIIIEWLVYSLAYVLMFVVMVTGVTAFLCTAIVFFMIVLLVSDIMDVYLKSEAQYAEISDKDDKPKSSLVDGPESDRKLYK